MFPSYSPFGSPGESSGSLFGSGMSSPSQPQHLSPLDGGPLPPVPFHQNILNESGYIHFIEVSRGADCTVADT
jgi:hypothetical protein